MKKSLLGLTAALVISTSFATATDKKDSGYFVSAKNNKAMSAMYLPETNITVLNYSDNTIFVTQPLNITIQSGEAKSISRNGYYDATYLVLADPWHTIFHAPVCRRAIVTVDNRGITVDGTYC